MDTEQIRRGLSKIAMSKIEQDIIGDADFNSSRFDGGMLWDGNMDTQTMTSQTTTSEFNVDIHESIANALHFIKEAKNRQVILLYQISEYHDKDKITVVEKGDLSYEHDLLVMGKEMFSEVRQTLEDEGYTLVSLDEYNINNMRRNQDLKILEPIPSFVSVPLSLDSFLFTPSVDNVHRPSSTLLYTPDVYSSDEIEIKLKKGITFMFCDNIGCLRHLIKDISGKRWANRARKTGWLRVGKNWYCPKCGGKNE
jgi:ribosomal protein L18E